MERGVAVVDCSFRCGVVLNPVATVLNRSSSSIIIATTVGKSIIFNAYYTYNFVFLFFVLIPLHAWMIHLESEEKFQQGYASSTARCFLLQNFVVAVKYSY